MLSSRGNVPIWELWVLKKMHMKPLQLRHMNKVFCVCHVEKSKHVHPSFDPHETQDMKYTWLQISFTSDVFSLRIFVCQRRIQTSWQVSREFSKDLFGRLLWILEAKHQKKLRIFTMLSWKDEAPSSDNLQDASEACGHHYHFLKATDKHSKFSHKLDSLSDARQVMNCGRLGSARAPLVANPWGCLGSLEISDAVRCHSNKTWKERNALTQSKSIKVNELQTDWSLSHVSRRKTHNALWRWERTNDKIEWKTTDLPSGFNCDDVIRLRPALRGLSHGSVWETRQNWLSLRLLNNLHGYSDTLSLQEVFAFDRNHQFPAVLRSWLPLFAAPWQCAHTLLSFRKQRTWWRWGFSTLA